MENMRINYIIFYAIKLIKEVALNFLMFLVLDFFLLSILSTFLYMLFLLRYSYLLQFNIHICCN